MSDCCWDKNGEQVVLNNRICSWFGVSWTLECLLVLGGCSAHDTPGNGGFIAVTIAEQGGNPQLHLMTPEGEIVETITDSGFNVSPVWAPNGRDIYFSRGEQIHTARIYRWNLDSWQLEPISIDSSLGTLVSSISPDGQTLYFHGYPQPPDDPRASEVYSVPVTGGIPTQMTNTAVGVACLDPAGEDPDDCINGAEWPSHAQSPRISPDGTRLVYMGTDEGTRQLRLMDLETMQHEPLTYAIDEPTFHRHSNAPFWADNNTIVHWGGIQGTIGNIWKVVIRPDRTRTQMTNRLPKDGGPGTSDAPCVSPDGQIVVFGGGMIGGGNAVFRMPITSENITDPEELGDLGSPVAFTCAWQPVPS
jgi:Tol biopolymer transport system component